MVHGLTNHEAMLPREDPDDAVDSCSPVLHTREHDVNYQETQMEVPLANQYKRQPLP